MMISLRFANRWKYLTRNENMKWITLICDEFLTLQQIRTMKHTGAVRAYDAGIIKNRYCVEYPGGHIFYDYDTDLQDWQDALEKIPFSASAVIMIVYTNAANVRQALSQPDFPQDIYVDNDFGVIMPLKEYIKAGMTMEE